MPLDLKDLEELRCPECHKPLVIVPVEGSTDKFRFLGCACPDKEEFFLPPTIAFGPKRGPMFLYVPKKDSEVAAD